MKPNNDREAITLILEGLVAKGRILDQVQDDTWDRDPNNNTKVSTVIEAVDLVTGVDEAFVYFKDKDGNQDGYIYFVLGNEPEEVACDYTVNLDPDLHNIIEPWWS